MVKKWSWSLLFCSGETGARINQNELFDQTADERTINSFAQHYLNGVGIATPADAPPLAGSNMISTVAHYLIIYT